MHACGCIHVHVKERQVGESLNLETLSILLLLISLYIRTWPGGSLTDTVHVCSLRSIAVGLEVPVSQMMRCLPFRIQQTLCNNYSFCGGALGVLACFEMESPCRYLCITLDKA